MELALICRSNISKQGSVGRKAGRMIQRGREMLTQEGQVAIYQP